MKIIRFLLGEINFIFIKLKYLKKLKSGWINYKILFGTSIEVLGNSTFHLGENLTTEKNVQLSACADGELFIGNNVYFNSNCIIVCRSKVNIGDNTIFGPGVHIFDHNHRFNANGKTSGYKCKDVIIGSNCWIGLGTIILSGAEIGNNCIIGAGSIISGRIPANSLVKSNSSLEIEKLY